MLHKLCCGSKSYSMESGSVGRDSVAQESSTGSVSTVTVQPGFKNINTERAPTSTENGS
ncbi:hypothetical protein CpipJ_CPIJ000531 [Culex quinquefasciatus]|uniref:Uncharacterized protein n=1 Tax=Culex quinquefasciatus TaxID=7176 RepID=B0W0G7_CULQU|nr:hypothetical protein CpipJ_CPIJ000531 [Culex quinquefasciatus]|eukprot:XP_001842201.1 hypothetical protein CpipJ_CPIJ000531 [Culex quinquefasciatus]